MSIRISSLMISLVILLTVFIIKPRFLYRKPIKEPFVYKLTKGTTYDGPNVKYKDNVYILHGNNFNVTEESIVLEEVDKNSFKEGMVLLGEEAPGFIRKINDILYEKDKTILVTSKLEIDDALMFLDFTKIFSLSQISQDNSDVKENFQNRNEHSTSFNHTVYLDDEQTQEISVNGNLSIIPLFDVDCYIRFGRLQRFSVVNNIKAIVDIKEKLVCTKAISKTFEKVIFPASAFQRLSSTWRIPITFGIWITINPECKTELALSLDVVDLIVENELRIETKKPFVMGIKYTRLEGVRTIYEPARWTKSLTRINNSINVSNKPTVTLDCYIKFTLNALLWGTIGPSFIISPYARWIGQFTNCPNLLRLQDCTLEQQIGPGINLTIKGQVFNFEVERELLDRYWPTII